MKPTKTLTRKQEIIGGAIPTIFIIWLIFKLFGGGDSGFNLEREMSNASVRCNMLVQAYLKSPSTAKFPADYTKGITVSEDNQIFTIHSHVDSQNSFGGTVRTPYTCKLQYTGGGQHGWELLDFQIE